MYLFLRHFISPVHPMPSPLPAPAPATILIRIYVPTFPPAPSFRSMFMTGSTRHLNRQSWNASFFNVGLSHRSAVSSDLLLPILFFVLIQTSLPTHRYTSATPWPPLSETRPNVYTMQHLPRTCTGRPLTLSTGFSSSLLSPCSFCRHGNTAGQFMSSFFWGGGKLDGR